MERKEQLMEALKAFQKQYPSVTSGDLQTFVLGTQACEAIMQSEIDSKNEVIKSLIDLLILCLDKDAELIHKTGKSLLGDRLIGEISDYVTRQTQIRLNELKKQA